MEKKDVPIIDFFAYTFKGFNIRHDNKKYIADFIYRHLNYILPDHIYDYMMNNKKLEYQIAENSGMGYRFRMFFPNIGVNIMTDGVTDGHGLHVVLAGSILRMAEMDRYKFQSFNNSMVDRIKFLCNIFNDTYGFGCVDPLNDLCDNSKPLNPEDISFLVSRCDIAYDFEVNFEEFFNRVSDGLIECRFKKLPNFNIDSENHGTIYLGSRSCSAFIRIYDKAKEVKDKMNTLLGISYDDVPEEYTRVEFEFKNERKYKLAMDAFNLYLISSEDIGNMCYKYLKFYDVPDPEKPDEKVLWDVYESVILYNNEDFMIEYDKTYQTSINLTYLQAMANMIVTYCRRIPGLLGFLNSNFSPSKSALRKSSNINLNFAEIYNSALEIENEQELIILEHLTFFNDEVDNV